MPKTGINLLEKAIKEAGKVVRPAVKSLAGFRKAKRAKQALFLKEFSNNHAQNDGK